MYLATIVVDLPYSTLTSTDHRNECTPITGSNRQEALHFDNNLLFHT